MLDFIRHTARCGCSMATTNQNLHSDIQFPVSEMAENLIGSEIIKLGNEIRERVSRGETIYNFTIGDFDPKIFPIPAELKKAIIECY
ncbi:MAG: hypothetical protein ACK57W_08300 [Flavobacteriales bacterium]